MVTSDFRPKVEIWPYRACQMKNMQYNPYLMSESPKYSVCLSLWGQFGHCGLGLWGRYTFHRTYF